MAAKPNQELEVCAKYNIEALSSYTKEPFQLMLTNRFAALHDISDPEDIFEEIATGILDTAKETLPTQETSHSNWMSPETKEAISSKHKIRKKRI